MRFTTILTGFSAATGVLSAVVPRIPARAPTSSANLPQLREAYDLALDSVGAGTLQPQQKRQGNALNIIATILVSTFELTIARIGAAIGIFKTRDAVADILDGDNVLKDLLKGTMTNALETVGTSSETDATTTTTTTTPVDKPQLFHAFDLAFDAVGADEDQLSQRQDLLDINLLILQVALDVITDSLDSGDAQVVTEDQARAASEGLQKALGTVIDTAGLV